MQNVQVCTKYCSKAFGDRAPPGPIDEGEGERKGNDDATSLLSDKPMNAAIDGSTGTDGTATTGPRLEVVRRVVSDFLFSL